MQLAVFSVLRVVFSLAGAALFIYGVRGLITYVGLRRRTFRAQTTIVDVAHYTDDDGVDLYAPVFEFDVAGTTYRNASKLFTTRKPVVNTPIWINIDPDNPAASEIHSWSITMFNCMPALLGLALILLGNTVFYLITQK